MLLPFDLSDPKTPELIFAETDTRRCKLTPSLNDAGFGETGYFTDTDIATKLNIGFR